MLKLILIAAADHRGWIPQWNLRKQWLGKDGFDYMKGIEQLNLPFFMITGGNDDIAPVSGCKRIYDHIGSDDKTWLECSLKKVSRETSLMASW
ncbi:hypothetical protein A3759_08175 [Thalassolituus sp. HI0120]|nr:hypothetical protein A3759_08175 [Thalassolituus sp. HI0120]